MISRDIAELVRQCLEDKRMQSGEGKAKTSIIDHLLQDEIVKFTSVDFEDNAGAQPLSPDMLAPKGNIGPPVNDGDFVDPRGWAEERLTPVMGIAQVDEMEARKTTRDNPAIAAPGRKTTGARPIVGDVPARPTTAPASREDATPGPESLASVLEPTPGPSRVPQAMGTQREPHAVPAPPSRPATRPARSFLIGMAIGAVLLSVAVATIVSRKSPSHAPAPPAQTP